MGRGPLPQDASAPPSGRVKTLLGLIRTMVVTLPPALRIQLAGAMRSMVDEFEQQAMADYDRANPPESGTPYTYTTTGTSR